MKNLKKMASIALMSTAMVVTPAMAQSNTAVASQPAVQELQTVSSNTNAPVYQFGQDIQASDVSYAFGDNQNLQMQQMTGQEMVETEGAFIPLFLVRASAYCVRKPKQCEAIIKVGGRALYELYKNVTGG